MDSKETRTAVVEKLAAVMAEGSLLAPHVAREIAEKQVRALISDGQYLVTNGEIYAVIETSGKDSGDDECEAWDVYTHPEPYEDEED